MMPFFVRSSWASTLRSTTRGSGAEVARVDVNAEHPEPAALQIGKRRLVLGQIRKTEERRDRSAERL